MKSIGKFITLDGGEAGGKTTNGLFIQSLGAEEPERVKVVDASQSLDNVQFDIKRLVEDFIMPAPRLRP